MALPEDVQAVLPAVVNHRLQLEQDVSDSGKGMAQELLEAVAIP